MITHTFPGRSSLRCVAALSVTFLWPLSASAERVFTPSDLLDWEDHAFADDTHYELTEKAGREALHAVCEPGAASGLFLREDIDLEETPVVEWDWLVKDTFSGIDETTRDGDDYAARLYAVDEHSVARWRTRALNYVWASEKPSGSSWENAYQSRARMIALQSGPQEGEAQWRTERRNLKEDFREHHDRDLDKINALAIMTDCDDVGEPVEAWYGEIRLLSE